MLKHIFTIFLIVFYYSTTSAQHESPRKIYQSEGIQEVLVTLYSLDGDKLALRDTTRKYIDSQGLCTKQVKNGKMITQFFFTMRTWT